MYNDNSAMNAWDPIKLMQIQICDILNNAESHLYCRGTWYMRKK